MHVQVVYFVFTVLEMNRGLTRNLSLMLEGCTRKSSSELFLLPAADNFMMEWMFVIGSFFPASFVEKVGRCKTHDVGISRLGYFDDDDYDGDSVGLQRYRQATCHILRYSAFFTV